MRRSSHPLTFLAGAWLVGLVCSQASGSGGWRGAAALGVFAAASLIGLWGALAHETSPEVGPAWRVALVLGAWVAGLAAPAGGDAAARPPPPGMARMVAVVEQSSALGEGEASSVL